MTLLSIILAFFPTLLLAISFGCLVTIVMFNETYLVIASLLLLVFNLYLFPLLTYRLHQQLFKTETGISYLVGKEYSPWWGAHQIQAIYVALPVLERILRMIPGVFSMWLRLWGSQIGKNVYWTPEIEIADRGLLEIGDRVVFGHRVGLFPHVIKPRKDNLMLYVKCIKIGDDVFMGAWSHLGPGVVVDGGTFVPVNTHIYPNQQVNQDALAD